MKRRVTVFLVAIIMILQPLVVTISYATEGATNEENIIDNSDVVSQVFNDVSLYEALKVVLGTKASYKDEENTITISKTGVEEVTELVLENKEITNLTGLDIFTNLKKLDLSGNKLDKNSNLQVLNSLSNLTLLDLSSNAIEDVASITKILERTDLELDLQNQNLRIIDFIDIVRINTPEEALAILQGENRTKDLEQIFLSYPDTEIIINKLIVNNNRIDSEDIGEYIFVNAEEGRIEFSPQNRVTKYEINLYLNSEKPTNKTNCSYKIYEIDKLTQTGIVFKDENLYKSVRDQLLKPKADSGLYEYTNWIYDNEDLIIIADKMELDAVDRITVNSRSVKDLTGLEKFVGLKELNLSDNSIINLNTISELKTNKETRELELKKQFEYLVNKLKESISERDKYEAEIKAIEKEIEEINKSTGNNTQSQSEETILEKEQKKAELELKIGILKELIISRVSALQSFLGGLKSSISDILTAPAAQKEIVEKSDKLTEIKDTDINELLTNYAKSQLIIEEVNLLNNNNLEKLATSIKNIFNNLTNEEIDLLLNFEIEDSVLVISTDDVNRIKAKYAKQELNTYIDGLNEAENLAFLNSEFNTKLGTDISSTKEVDGKQVNKTIEELKKEMKDTALNNAYLNNKFTEIIALYLATGKEESKLKDLGREEIITLFGDNLVKECKKISDEKYGIKDKTGNALTASSIINYENLKDLLDIQAQRLTTVYNNLNQLLINDEGIIEGKYNNYLTEVEDGNVTSKAIEDMLLISNRLSNIPQEDIDEIIKIADLEILVLDRNLITDVNELANVPTIKQLYLGDNLISKFDFTKFDNLEVLSLENNCMQEVEIKSMSNLIGLSLAGNRLDNVDNIKLSGLPKLEELFLDRNEIKDIKKILASSNEKILRSGYTSVADVIKSGTNQIVLSIMGQVLEVDLKIDAVENAESVEVKLPNIFSQVKALQKEGVVSVVYEKVYPCLNVYNDGTKINIDVTQKDVQRTGQTVINMKAGNRSHFADGTTYKVNYIVTSDKTAPTISSVEGNPTEWTNQDVTLTVNATDDKSTNLLYKFNEEEWKSSNQFTVANNQNVTIQVKDEAQNVSTMIVKVEKIDKAAPVVSNIEGISEETTNQDVTLRVNATDAESGIAEYSFDNGTTWQTENTKTYQENTSGIIIKVKDNAGNVSEGITKDIQNIDKTDRTAPVISEVKGNPTEWTSEAVTLTVIATDETSTTLQYSFNDGVDWQTENTKTYQENTSGIIIKVKDEAGNISEGVTVNIEKIGQPEVQSLEIISDKYVVNTTSKLITNIPSKLTASGLKDNLVTNATNIVLEDKDGNQVSDNSNLATGMVIKFTLNNEIGKFVISVRGDVNGDSEVDFNDILQANKQRLEKVELETEYKVAGDVNDDGVIDFNDILRINKFRLGKIETL